MRWAMAVIVVLVACGSKSKESKEEAGQCKTLAKRLIPDREPLSIDEVDKLRGVVEKLCPEWSADVRECFEEASTERERERCSRKLTKAQQDKLTKAFEAVADDENTKDDEPAPLTVQGLEPNTGDPEGGTYVVVSGTSFIKAGPRNVKVYFGAVQGTVIRFQSDTELIVQAPGGKSGETVEVQVVFEPGGAMKVPQKFSFK